MAKYFKHVQSLEDLKNQFKVLARKNHPDAGGDADTMKEINCEYDALFPIWKDQHNTAGLESQTHETAESTRQNFYTEFGWEGKNHNWNRTLKEVAQIVRAYVKEKYPTYKFSVRTSYASMCQELHVEMKESPIEIYKSFEELTLEEKNAIIRRMRTNNLFTLNDCFSDSDLKAEFERIWSDKSNYYKCVNEATKAVVNDVDAFVKSYNYQDCDGMIDYFDVDFYYLGCLRNNGEDIKIIPKTVRNKSNKKSKPVRAGKTAPKQKKAPEIVKKARYTYKITQGEDTRDGSILWVVRIEETLDKMAYIAENNHMQALGGYYSRFKHGFIFKYNPAEKLSV